MLKALPLVLMSLVLAGCATAPAPASNASSSAMLAPRADEQAYVQMLSQGMEALPSDGANKTIERYYDPVLAEFQKRFGDAKEKLYSARTLQEALLYMALSAARSEDALVISSLWSEAHYLKAFAYLEVGKVDEAKVWMDKALAMSPENATYLAERGYIDHIEKNWAHALTLFEKAESSAQHMSPENEKNQEWLRALRGSGYSLIELGRLDEAERKYQQCLKLDPKDEKAMNELEYIKELRATKT